jgi:putative PIN family toxin of toxin-antitoxin system
VLIDTNIFISYLLKSDEETTITRIIEAAFENKYTLLLPHEVIAELDRKLSEKKYLASRITKEEAQEFTELLTMIAEEIPAITEEIPRVSSDKKDDYLLAYALVGKADYLVSGDEILQKINEVENITIVSPAEFLIILNKKDKSENS